MTHRCSGFSSSYHRPPGSPDTHIIQLALAAKLSTACGDRALWGMALQGTRTWQPVQWYFSVEDGNSPRDESARTGAQRERLDQASCVVRASTRDRTRGWCAARSRIRLVGSPRMFLNVGGFSYLPTFCNIGMLLAGRISIIIIELSARAQLFRGTGSVRSALD